jgi:beta-lactamase regulating signal transducer with metallopeptidase domain
MADWWIQSVEASAVRGGIALAVVWAFCLFPSVPAAVRCWMWRAAYGVVLVSFFWTRPVELAVRPAVTVNPPAAEVRPVRPLEVAKRVFDPTVDEPESGSAAIAISNPVQRAAVENGSVNPRPVWPRIAISVWLAFVTVYFARLLAGWFRARRLRRGRTIPLPDLAELCRAVGVRRIPAVVASESIRSPLLVGVRRPVIVLPVSAVTSPDLPMIFAHELAHLRRRDLLWNWLPIIATAILPLHPMVWIANRRWRLATESACDAAAMAATAAAPSRYGRLLIHVAAAPSGWGVLAVAATAESRWLLKRRLIAMTTFTSWNQRRTVSAGLLAGVFAAAAAVPWRVVAQQPPASTTKPAAVIDPATSQPASPGAAVGADGPVTAAPITGDKSIVIQDGKLVAVPSGMTLVFNPKPAAATPTTMPVPVDAAFSQAFARRMGHITATIANLSAGASGNLTGVYFHEGQPVKAGDLIYQIQDSAERAKLDYAKAALDEKRVLLAQKTEAFKNHVVAESEMQESKLAVELAAAQVNMAEAELDHTRVIAPFDGTLGATDLQVGEQVTGGQTLTTLVQSRRLKATMELDPGYPANSLRPGMRVLVQVSKLKEIPAVLTFIAPAADPATGKVTVRARLADGAYDLIVGSECEVTMPVMK